ncbi:Putative adhesin [Amycolatopsis arida]|uniref:Putative adhesin n=1 Tax=Amycolatopsis arida TaxID=587909 RepID=A0A1I5T883_9PSEU|nr:DUF4097 family beta strand repeat-containing protein [Amycolatopsis arida]TDX96188.1 putative adhesin [Amycolatopsis arida]SFP79252.1 Putative adhesin [Amycolatopsis arida]
MGRAGLAIGGVAMIGLGAALAFGWVWPSTAEATATVSEPFGRVAIDNGSGEVAIRAADVPSARVTTRFSYRFGRPDTSYEVREGELRLGDCGRWCSVDYDVEVPRGTKIAGRLGSGELIAEGVAEVDVEASSGELTLRDVAGPVRARLSSGDLAGTGLRGPVDVRASSGEVRLEVTEPVDVRVRTSSGDIEAAVPDVPYRVEGASRDEDRRIDVVHDPAAPRVLRLDASSGEIRAHTR